jgi:hypothetical protein
MGMSFRLLSACAVMLTTAAVPATLAQPPVNVTQPSALEIRPLEPVPRAGQRTGKERLGEKWTDEQRIDNCKVPTGKRGVRSRPEDCAHLPTS